MERTVYLFVAPDIMGDLAGYAMAADGVLLADAIFPTIEAARAHMDKPCRAYRKHYPEGYELIWVEDVTAPGPWREAIERNAALWEADRPAREAAHAQIVADLAETRRQRQEAERREITEPMDVTAELEMLRRMTAPPVRNEENEE